MKTRRVLVILVFAVAVVALSTGPLWTSPYLLLLGLQVLQLAALAQAWSLLAGQGGIVSLAVSAFVGIGSYTVAEASTRLGAGPYVGILLAGAAAAAAAALVSVPMFRFRGMYFTIGSLVLAQAIALYMATSSVFGGSKGLMTEGAIPTDQELYELSLAVTVVAFLGAWLTRRSRLGLGMRAVRDDEDVAARMGVAAFRAKLAGFVVGAAIMGFVGGIQATRLGYVEPGAAFNFSWTINTLNASIIGGMTHLLGPVVGAVATVALGEALSSYATLHLIILGLILITMIRLAPDGVVGLATRLVGNVANRRIADTGPSDALEGPHGASAPRSSKASRQLASAGGPVLSVKDLGKRFGGVPALDGVSFEVQAGSVLGIVGPNGAGKSTLIGLISGALQGSGTVTYAGQEITQRDARERALLGIGRTHQVPRPFERLTVMENLLVALMHTSRVSRQEAEVACRGILARCGLAAEESTQASELGLLRLKRLELARALALKPKVLLLDEIGAGLVEAEIVELIALINDLSRDLDAVIVVEHVMDVIRQCCDSLIVIERGRLLVQDTPDAALADARVAAVYLGTEDADEKLETVVRAAVPARDRPLLELRSVAARYGHHRALGNVSFAVGEGQIVTLLGANGAGKTTTAKVISGLLKPSAGEIWFDGQRIDGLAAHERVRLGIAHCMEGRRIFADLTVEENLLLGAAKISGAERTRVVQGVWDLFPDLWDRRTNAGTALSGGQQQMLAIGRALVSQPRLIVFDEISLGLAPITVSRLYEALAQINSRGVSMIVIEQNVDRGLSLADRVEVMQKGTIALSGSPENVRQSNELTHLYVGSAVGT